MATIDERLSLVDYQETRTRKARFTPAGLTFSLTPGREIVVKILEDDVASWGRRTFMYFTDSAEGHTKIHKSQMSYWDTFKWIGGVSVRMNKPERARALFDHLEARAG